MEVKNKTNRSPKGQDLDLDQDPRSTRPILAKMTIKKMHRHKKPKITTRTRIRVIKKPAMTRAILIKI
jgi:hypothetical protein